MRFTYGQRYNIAYIRFHAKNAEVETIQISDELNVDVTPDGTIYDIELLNANEQLQSGNTGRLLIINEATGEQKEFPLSIIKGKIRHRITLSNDSLLCWFNRPRLNLNI